MNKEQVYHLGVKAIIQNPQGDILILKSTGFGGWDLPGGRVQQNENIQDTLLREVKEETGLIHLENITPYGIALTPIKIPLSQSQFARLIFYCHTCLLSKAQTIVLSSEHENFLWTDWENAKTLLSVDFNKFIYTEMECYSF